MIVLLHLEFCFNVKIEMSMMKQRILYVSFALNITIGGNITQVKLLGKNCSQYHVLCMQGKKELLKYSAARRTGNTL